MNITKSQLIQIIKEEVSNLQRPGGFADPLSGLGEDPIIKTIIQAHGGRESIAKNYDRESGRYLIYVDNGKLEITEDQLKNWEKVAPWTPTIVWAYKKYPSSPMKGGGSISSRGKDNHALLVLSDKNRLMLSIQSGTKGS